MIKDLDPNKLIETIQTNDLPVLIDFWAAWCLPCRMMEPLVSELATEFIGKIIVVKLNTDLYPGITAKFNVSGIPTFIIFHNQGEVYRKTGAVSRKELKQAIGSVI